MSTSESIHRVRAIRIIKDDGIALTLEVVYDDLLHQSDADVSWRKQSLFGEFRPWFGNVTITRTLTLFPENKDVTIEVTPNLSVGTYVDKELLEYTE
jgi:hypothetical protein